MRITRPDTEFMSAGEHHGRKEAGPSVEDRNLSLARTGPVQY